MSAVYTPMGESTRYRKDTFLFRKSLVFVIERFVFETLHSA